MFCPECGNHAANKALRKLGIKSERKKTVVTFDGLLGGKETFPIQLEQNTAFVKVSDTAIVPDKVNLLFTSSGAVVTIESKDLLSQSDNGLAMYVHQGVILVITVEKDMDDGSGTIIKGGTYVRFEVTRGCYVSSIESTTETIHPIDQKYLPNDTIDLTKFTCKVNGTEQTFNDAIVALFQLSMQNNGAMGTVTFRDDSCELHKAAYACNHPALMIQIEGNFIKYPTVYGFKSDRAWQLSARGVMVTAYGVVEATCIIDYMNSGGSIGEISVSAKVLA